MCVHVCACVCTQQQNAQDAFMIVLLPPGWGIRYCLYVDDKPLKEFTDARTRSTKTWYFPIGDERHLVVMGKIKLATQSASKLLPVSCRRLQYALSQCFVCACVSVPVCLCTCVLNSLSVVAIALNRADTETMEIWVDGTKVDAVVCFLLLLLLFEF